MKKNASIIILVAIIALGGFWAWKNQDKKVESQNNNQVAQEEQNTQIEKEEKSEETNQEISDPEKVVREYFKLHLDELNKRSSVNSALSLKFVTKNFVNNFNKLKKPLFYDPFICAQDYPNDISSSIFETEEKNDNFAVVGVKVDKIWNVGFNKVQLIKDGNFWKIDKIICSTSGGVF
jgi:uncharacterized protein YxeA